MRRIAAIAVNTFREAVRDRVLYGLLGVALFVLLFTLPLAELSLHQERRIVHDIGIASISLFSVIAAIFLGSSLVYKEIERKTLYVILPKPIHRHEFLIGKYLGIVLTSMVFIAVMGAVQLWVSFRQHEGALLLQAASAIGLPALLGLLAWRARDRTAILVPWSAVALAANIAMVWNSEVKLEVTLSSLAIISGEVFVIAAVAVFFSAFARPMLAALFTLGIWLAGRILEPIAALGADALEPGLARALGFVADLFPGARLFVPNTHALDREIDLYGTAIQSVTVSLGYAAVYSFILLSLAALLFRRRDFL
jgi:ABC-type transport system involved in multi-copper enzyme maturation permease subunit